MKGKIKIVAFLLVLAVTFNVSFSMKNGLLQMRLKEVKAAVGGIKTLGELPTGSIVYDSTTTWEFRGGTNYNGLGEIKPIEWLVVAHNHYKSTNSGKVLVDYSNNHTTLIVNKLIGSHCFDDSGYYGINHWGKSGGNEGTNPPYDSSTKGIRKFLNGSSYIGYDNHTYTVTFYDSFSENFKNIILITTNTYKTYDSSRDTHLDYNTEDKIFLPSINELGGSYYVSNGVDWGYFKNNSLRKANLGSNSYEYYLSTLWGADNNSMCFVCEDGYIRSTASWVKNSKDSLGIRPVINVKSDIAVENISDDKWKIKWDHVWNQNPTITLDSPTSNSPLQCVNNGVKEVV